MLWIKRHLYAYLTPILTFTPIILGSLSGPTFIERHYTRKRVTKNKSMMAEFITLLNECWIKNDLFFWNLLKSCHLICGKSVSINKFLYLPPPTTTVFYEEDEPAKSKEDANNVEHWKYPRTKNNIWPTGCAPVYGHKKRWRFLHFSYTFSDFPVEVLSSWLTDGVVRTCFTEKASPPGFASQWTNGTQTELSLDSILRRNGDIYHRNRRVS